MTKKIKILMISGIIVILLCLAGFTFRNKIFADISGYPAWFSSSLVSNLQGSSWNQAQKQGLLSCMNDGTVNSDALTDFEKHRYGEKAKAFNARTNNVSNLDSYRVIVYQVGLKDNNPQIAFAIGNISSRPISANFYNRYIYSWIPTDNSQTISESSGTTGMFMVTDFSGGTMKPVTVSQGQYVEIGDNGINGVGVEYGVNPIYSRLNFSLRSASGPSESFCIPEPLDTQSVKSFTYPPVVYPGWLDADVVDKAQNKLSADQVAQLNYCVNRYTPVSKQTPTANELNLFGPNVKVFEIASSHYYDPLWVQWEFYAKKYRLAIAPTKVYQGSSGNKIVKYKVGIGNPGSTPLVVPGSSVMQIYFMGVNSTNQAAAYSGLFNLNFPYGGTLQTGNYIQAETSEFAVDSNAVYSTFSFGTEIRVGDGASPVGCIADPVSIKDLDNILAQTQTTTPVPTPIPTSTSTLTPQPTATQIAISNVNYNFRKGFTAFGASTPFSASKIAEQGMYLYKFDGAGNKWVLYPGSTLYSTEAGGGYYVYSSQAKSVSLPFTPMPTTNYTLTKGWNMLYTTGNKTLSTLNLTYNGQTKTAQQMINDKLIYDKVFIIDDDSAAAACKYFKLLATATVAPDCSNNVLGSDNLIPSGKNFWVYVN